MILASLLQQLLEKKFILWEPLYRHYKKGLKIHVKQPVRVFDFPHEFPEFWICFLEASVELISLFVVVTVGVIQLKIRCQTEENITVLLIIRKLLVPFT